MRPPAPIPSVRAMRPTAATSDHARQRPPRARAVLAALLVLTFVVTVACSASEPAANPPPTSAARPSATSPPSGTAASGSTVPKTNENDPPVIEGGDVDLDLAFHNWGATFTLTKLSVVPAPDPAGKTKITLSFDADNATGPYDAHLNEPSLTVAGLDYVATQNSTSSIAAGEKKQGTVVFSVPGNRSVQRDDMALRADEGNVQAAVVPLGKKGTLIDFPPIVSPVTGTLTAGTDTISAKEVQVSAVSDRGPSDRDAVVVRVLVSGSTTTENGANTIAAWLKRPDGMTSAGVDPRRAAEPKSAVTGWPRTPATSDAWWWFQVPADVGGTYTMSYNRDGKIGSMDLTIPQTPRGWGDPTTWTDPTATGTHAGWYDGGVVEVKDATITTKGTSRYATVTARLSADILSPMAVPDPLLVVNGKRITTTLPAGYVPRSAAVTEKSWRYSIDDGVDSLDTASIVFGPADRHQVTLALGEHPTEKGWNGAPVPQQLTGSITAGPDTVTITSATVVAYSAKPEQAPAGQRVLRVVLDGSTTTDAGANTLEATLKLPDGSTVPQLTAVYPPVAARAITGWPQAPASRAGQFDFAVPDAFAGVYTLTYHRDKATASVDLTLK